MGAVLSWLIPSISGLIALWIFAALPRQRRVVPRDETHVAIRQEAVVVYSGTPDVACYCGRTYDYLPGWVPLLGMDVTEVPLSVVELRVPEMVTFAAMNARFTRTTSVYVRVTDPLKSAQRWPGRTIESFTEGVQELMENAIRNTTPTFAAEETIEKKDEIASTLHHALARDMAEYGCIKPNIGIVDITDAPDNTVIGDIARKREAEINSESRQTVALKEREARIVEAENRQAAEMRESAAAEAIGVRDRERERTIFISQQEIATAEMDVEQSRKVRTVEIERDAAIERAQGERQAVILRREAEAEAIAKCIEALNHLQEEGRAFRTIRKDEKVGLELAKPLQSASLKLVSPGEVASFLDMFSASGGAKLGSFIQALRETNPDLADRLVGLLGRLGGTDSS